MRRRIMMGTALATTLVCLVVGFLGWKIRATSHDVARLQQMGAISREMTGLQRSNATGTLGVVYLLGAQKPEDAERGAAQLLAGFEEQLAHSASIEAIAAELDDPVLAADLDRLAAGMAKLTPLVEAIRANEDDPTALVGLLVDPEAAAAAVDADEARLALERSVARRIDEVGEAAKASEATAQMLAWAAAVLLAVGGLSVTWVLATRVVRRISDVSGALAGAAARMQQLGVAMRGAAQLNAEETERADRAAGEVGSQVRESSTVVSQLGGAANEIANTAATARAVVSRAVDEARSAEETMRELADASAEIGTVVQLIAAVAEQTNLLALNATIEAARAGEAGRGFAVVANEVKDLATQTSSATNDIGRRIASIQGTTERAAAAMGSIKAIVSDVAHHQHTIASAVEEQSASVTQVSAAMAGAASNTAAISSSIERVVSSTVSTEHAVQELLVAVDELSEGTRSLERLVRA